MEDFVEAFLAESDYADSTRSAYRYALNRLATWLAERDATIDNLTAATYLAFLNGHGWSANMRRQYASAVRAFLRWLGHRDHPVFSIILPPDNAKTGRALVHEDLQNLLASFDTSTALGIRNLAMLALMVETGLRIAEVCRLKLSDVDLKRRQLQVLAKNEKYREGVFSEVTANYLLAWLAQRAELALPGVPFLFVSEGGISPGRGMTPGGLRKMFSHWGIRSEVGRLSPHDMRRTMCMLLIEAGAPSRIVQVLGGWEDLKMVERYSRNLKPKTEQIDRYSPLLDLRGPIPVKRRNR